MQSTLEFAPIVKGITLEDVRNQVIKDHRERTERALERVERVFNAALTLESAGFEFHYCVDTQWEIGLGRVERESLPELRRKLGRMEVTGKTVMNARKRIIRVHVKVKDMPVTFYYEKKLPRKKDGVEIKCRIVKNVHVTHSLVCEM